MDDLLLLVRVAVSLACVLALIWFVGRRVGAQGVRRRGGRTGPGVRVLGRQSLGHRSGVALVAVGERTLLLGVADQGVSVLADVTGTQTDTEQDVPASPAAVEDELPVRTVTRQGGQLREELDLEAMLAQLEDLPVASGERVRVPVRTGAAATSQVPSALEGSVLAPQTWRRTWDVLQHRAVRR